MRTGKRVAFDIGKSRIGVAISDYHGILASPREYIARLESDSDTTSAMVEIANSEEAIEIYVGLPMNLKNAATESTSDAIRIASLLAKKTPIPVQMMDERLTTKVAATALQQAGKDSRKQRGFIDSAAAAVILEAAMNFEKVNGIQPGSPIEDFDGNE